jgi:hypothetical protein
MKDQRVPFFRQTIVALLDSLDAVARLFDPEWIAKPAYRQAASMLLIRAT